MDQSTMPPHESPPAESTVAPFKPADAADVVRPSASPLNGRRTSAILREFLASHPEPRISLGDLRDALEDRGFGILLFIFALPTKRSPVHVVKAGRRGRSSLSIRSR